MFKIFRLFVVLAGAIVLVFCSNCQRNKFSSGPLTFSTDTLTFDTVFVTQGSTTQSFTVHNNSKYPVKINSVQLSQSGTQFRINVDGLPGNQNNVEILSKDSMYVFAEVTVDPNNTNNPFVLYAYVNFTIGNNTQTVVLQAWGQNAHFHYGEQIPSGAIETWTNDKPHVVIANDTQVGVIVGYCATLNIQSGCKIFMANNSSIYVLGTLNAYATSWQDSIIFRGIRLESYYQGLPGQWGGIFFLRNPYCASTGHFQRCIIDESTYGVEVGNAGTSNPSFFQVQSDMPVVTMDKTIISNSLNNAVFGFNGNITATNSLFFLCGSNLISLGLGGNYTFTNCTMYNVSTVTINHEQPNLLLSNFAANSSTGAVYPAPLTTTFNNCVIYGSLTNEISFNNIDSPNLARFNNTFTNCLLQTPYDTLKMFTNAYFNNIFNQDPMFKNPTNNDFTPSDSTGYFSSLIDYCPGGLPSDLYDRRRPVSLTNHLYKYDIGAIETQH